MRRSAFISPYQQIALELVLARLNFGQMEKHLGEFDALGVLYSTLLQAGLDRLEFIRVPVPKPERVNYLFGRLIAIGDKGWHQDSTLAIRGLAHDAMGHSPDEGAIKAHAQVIVVISELLFSLRTRRPVILFTNRPQSIDVPLTLPTEEQISLHRLFASFRDAPVEALTFRTTVDERSAESYKAILESRGYARLAAAHADLSDGSLRLASVCTAISTEARALTRQFPSLGITKASVAILRVSESLFETVYGKLPAALVKPFLRGVTTLLNERQRLVIYPIAEVVHQIARVRTDALIAKAGPDAYRAWQIELAQIDASRRGGG